LNITQEIIFDSFSNKRLANLCGQFDENLRHIENQLKINILSHANSFKVTGNKETVSIANKVIQSLYGLTLNQNIDFEQVHIILQEYGMQEDDKFSSDNIEDSYNHDNQIQTPKKLIRPRGRNQNTYLAAIQQDDLSFGIGPAGTGKTYLAVASAIQALENDEVRRIILVRPAVEAGENLGFLPGDLSQKVDPYLRPMYDALYDMLGSNQVTKLIEQNLIEVAPLAFMRGRSLNESFLILDEAQNTTIQQMKMFLTRIGFGSRAVVTGDITQIDLPKGQKSGLIHCAQILKQIDKISFTYFLPEDVVRHDLVKLIIKAYESENSN
jgi:phosphate starvation-inducible PhoH-like protein|tara:strand:- start:5343 stop:6317 length:975 start_codon:yes stop_codon:yes gene_type:complete